MRISATVSLGALKAHTKLSKSKVLGASRMKVIVRGSFNALIGESFQIERIIRFSSFLRAYFLVQCSCKFASDLSRIGIVMLVALFESTEQSLKEGAFFVFVDLDFFGYLLFAFKIFPYDMLYLL